MQPNYLGIEIGGTKLQIVLGTADGEILERRKLRVEAANGATGIRAQIENALPELVQGRPLNGIGIGFGGPVDWRSGKICRSHQIAGWSEFDLTSWLKSWGRVFADNDANVAALGEATRGAGVGFDPVFYVTLGSGVGGGLVVGGAIYHGATPGEAEIGHVRLDKQGTTVESRCSGWAVDATIRGAINRDPSSALAREAGASSGGEARHLVAALRQGDRVAKDILQELASDLAFGLSHVIHLFHPQIIILGGGLSSVGEPLREAVETRLLSLIMEAFQPGPRVTLAALGEDAVPVGALKLAAGRAEGRIGNH